MVYVNDTLKQLVNNNWSEYTAEHLACKAGAKRSQPMLELYPTSQSSRAIVGEQLTKSNDGGGEGITLGRRRRG
jgi:hypothetical protein